MKKIPMCRIHLHESVLCLSSLVLSSFPPVECVLSSSKLLQSSFCRSSQSIIGGVSVGRTHEFDTSAECIGLTPSYKRSRHVRRLADRIVPSRVCIGASEREKEQHHSRCPSVLTVLQDPIVSA